MPGLPGHRPGDPVKPITVPEVWPHPAKWSQPVLDVVADLVASHTPVGSPVLDPFAGVGRRRLDEALAGAYGVVGVDLQPEAAPDDADTIQGDATDLPTEWTDTFSAIATSPCYGNRMADHHDARDESQRNTYAHTLRAVGGELVPGSAAGMQFGRDYRNLHAAFLREAARVLVDGAVAVINMSNHVRDGVEVRVVEWWLNELIVQGWRIVEVRRVVTRRQRMGANGNLRVDAEHVICVRRPT